MGLRILEKSGEEQRGGIKEIPIFAFSLNDKRIYFYGY
jgi:hypothetical protein